MIKTGRFFSTLLPGLAGSYASIEKCGIYEIENSVLIKEKSFRRIFTYRPLILPSFIFRITEINDVAKNIINPVKTGLDYPPLTRYKRDELKIEISPAEVRFEKDAELIFVIEDNIVVKNIPATGALKMNLPDEFISALNKNKSGRILFTQNNFSFLLEEWQSRYSLKNVDDDYSQNSNIFDDFFQAEKDAGITYRKELINSRKRKGYLSVKDLLDPENGFERLIDDILSQKFAKGWIKNRQKMAKLLDIIRVSKSDEEEKIMQALFINDLPFYLQVTEELFQDCLLPYMSRKEVSAILAAAPDEILISIFREAEHKRLFYRNLISKNRYKDLESLYKRNKIDIAESENPKKTALWEHIENDYRLRKERFLNIDDEEHDIFVRQHPEAKVKRAESPLAQKPIGYYLNSNSFIRTVEFQKNNLALNIKRAFYSLVVLIEKRKGLFFEYSFHSVKEGILIIRNIERKPRFILSAGVDSERNLHESFSYIAREAYA
ncbi:MAG: hypothetical protein OEZ13_04560 [Spirochaetia bacterium]|nr:hypothetical protein [Spirochaetia bacterium]